jgi:hypothetical protein
MHQQGWNGPKTSHIFVGNMIENFQFHDQKLLKDLGIWNFDIEARVSPSYAFYSQKFDNQLHHYL